MSNEIVRTEKGQYPSGVSGNPTGRPKSDRTIQELARTHSADALAALLAIARSGESESARVAAAVALLDRGWGKPPVSVHVEPARSVVIRAPMPCADIDEWRARYEPKDQVAPVAVDEWLASRGTKPLQ
jgi:hypothetical protein